MRTCDIHGCDRKHKAHGLCFLHYQRVRNRTPLDKPEPGTERSKDASGYVITYVGRKKYYEHRLIMEQMLGRPLIAGENVHHVNGQRDDNRPENLELWSTSQPAGQRVADKIRFANEIHSLYGTNPQHFE